METVNLVKNCFDEVTCSVCLEYFKDPVMVDCGHNFCQACISQCLEKAEEEPSCPQCRGRISQGNVRPNRPLITFVELIKKLQLEKLEKDRGGVCWKHQELLKLFCKEDHMCICVVCHVSKEHKDHNMLPLDEAFEEFKENIKNQIPSLMKKRQEFETLSSDEEQKSQKSLAYLEKEKENIMSAFEQLQKTFDENKRVWLTWLDDLELKMKENREENITELFTQITNLNSLIAEIGAKCQQPVDEFLQDIADCLDRYKNAEDRKLVLKPFWELERTLKQWTERREALEKVAKDCKDSLEKPLQKVCVTLDPDTAHPYLFVSEDWSSVTKTENAQNLPLKPERFDAMWSVLGCEKFTTGKHYWDVEIPASGTGWILGVALECVRRKCTFTIRPEEGVWAIQSYYSTVSSGYSYQSTYQVSALMSPLQIINSSWNLSKVRVFLDYEAGSVAFSEASSGTSIFTFSAAHFAGEEVRPFFNLYQGASLKCC